MQGSGIGDPQRDADPPVVLRKMSAVEQGVRTGTLVAISAGGPLVPQRVWCVLLDDAVYLAVAPWSPVATALDEDGRVCLLLDGPEGQQAVTGTAHLVAPEEQSDPALSRVVAGAPAGRLLFRIQPVPLAPPEAIEDPADRRLLVQHIFSDLPRTLAGVMARRLHYHSFDSGAEVIKQGTVGDHFFIVVDGEVDVLQEGESGEQLLTTLGPGESFGETALLLDMPRTATVRARTPLRVLTLDKHTFDQVVLLSSEDDGA